MRRWWRTCLDSVLIYTLLCRPSLSLGSYRDNYSVANETSQLFPTNWIFRLNLLFIRKWKWLLIGEIFDPGTHRPPVHWQTRFMFALQSQHRIANLKFFFFPARKTFLIIPLKKLFWFIWNVTRGWNVRHIKTVTYGPPGRYVTCKSPSTVFR
jgi:hypothetical protein